MASFCFAIAVEPQERHRFRTPKEGSHGVLVGDDESFPTVVLKVNSSISPNFDVQKLKVYCYATANNNVEQPLMLSPHTLRKKSGDDTSIHLIKAEEITPYEYNYTIKDCWIAKSTQKTANNVIDKSIHEYRNLGISHSLQTNTATILKQKFVEYLNLGLPQKKIEELNRNVGREQTKAIEMIYLAFSVFSEYTQEWLTVFSERILNLDPIHINLLCPPRISMTGPDRPEIVLLVRDVEFDYALEVRELDEDTMNNKWVETSSIYDIVQQNKALIYKLPIHPNTERRESINCLIKLKHGRSESNEVGIVFEGLMNHQTLKRPSNFERDDAENNKKYCSETIQQSMLGGRKAAVDKTMTDSVDIEQLLKALKFEETPAASEQHIETDSEPVVTQKENVFQHLLKLGQTVKELTDKDENEIWNAFVSEDIAYRKDMFNTFCQDGIPAGAFNSIDCGSLFHDAIQISDFFTVERILCELESDELYERIRERLGSFRDWHGRTLLHTAFFYEKFEFLKSLLNMRPDALLVQDQHGNTPLHLAVQCRRDDWLEIIEYNDFYNVTKPASIDRMSRLLRIYNHSNLTVLHSSIKNNCQALVELLLQHCKRCNIDACEIRVLGSGDSLMHLVAKMSRNKECASQAEAMERIILKYYSHAAEYVNYAGYKANGDYCEASTGSDSSDVELSSSDSDELSNEVVKTWFKSI